MKILAKIAGVVVVIICLGTLLPTFFPLMETASDDVGSMNATGAGGEIVKVAFPIVVVIVGLTIGIGLVVWAIRKMRGLSRS